MNDIEPVSGIFDKILRYRGRASELAVGLAANEAMCFAFDYLLYPAVIYKYGPLWGGGIMIFLSLITCLLTIWFYDWSQRDWLGIEAIKDLKNYQGEKNIARFSAWFLKKSNPAIFLFLTFVHDPFITAAYFRKGKFNGMTRRDWTIFFGSFLLCNGYWTFACYTGITLVEWVWRGVKGLVV